MQTSAEMRVHISYKVCTSAWWLVTDTGQVARGKEAKGFAPFVCTSVQKKIGTTEAVAA